ncbi:MAG: VWA domain-containing protein [Pseudomonadota bacterium]|nr:VWA domain-containing protein [Pseudomonadota bacterium]
MRTILKRCRQRGAILVTFAISALVLIAFSGLALDVGLMYMTRAALSKGVDAGALMGVRSLSLGDAQARAVAESTFRMNYAASRVNAREVEQPTVAVTIAIAPDGNKRITVDARVRTNTYFLGVLRLLPGGGDFTTVSTSSHAQAMRARLVMGIALDRSGSMASNGGRAALPGAVEAFVGFFDNAIDRVALSSYADHATLDFAMNHNFKTAIGNRVRSMPFSGWTYSHGGIDIVRDQVRNVPLDPNENVLKVLVFFTDGHANSFLAPSIRCTGNNFRSLVLVPDSSNDGFHNPASGATVTCTHTQSDRFNSLRTGTNITRSTGNVENEGLFMAERSARLTRQDGTLVFAIGLGNDINKASLRRIANDPSSSTFNPNEPVGVAAFAPTAGELTDVFRLIASKILLRLTQ